MAKVEDDLEFFDSWKEVVVAFDRGGINVSGANDRAEALDALRSAYEGGDEEEEDEDETGDGYDQKNVEDLKELLKDRDLPVSGNKDELVQRLRDDDEAF